MALLDSLRRRLEKDPRLARMLHGGASGLLGRLVALVISAITLPLTVRYLGQQEYGVWVTIATTVVMFNVLDLGIASTLQNFISEAYATGDKAKAQQYYATAFWVTVGVSAGLGLLCYLVYPFIDFGGLLHLTDPVHIRHARLTVAVAVVYFLLSLPLNLADRVLSGYQQVHLANYFQMINSVLALIALEVVIHLGGTILTLMIAFVTGMLLGALGKQVWLSGFSKPWILPDPRHFDRQVAHQLFSQGVLFFILQLTGLVVFNSDNLVITHYLGAAEVTPYSVAWRLTSYASLLQSELIPAFWPAFTEAYKKREMRWVRKTYREMVTKVMLAVTVAALLIGLFGRFIIGVWVGPQAQPPLLLLWTMAGWAVLVSATTNQALLLTAVGRLRLETTVAVLAAVANLWMSIVLVQRIKAEGVILSTILSFAIFMIVPQELEVRRVLRGDFLEPLPVAELPAEELPVGKQSAQEEAGEAGGASLGETSESLENKLHPANNAEAYSIIE